MNATSSSSGNCPGMNPGIICNVTVANNMRNSANKHVPLHALTHRPWPSDAKIVLTNGCFDILHRAHVEFLEEASRLGDLLVVAVNSDTSVRQLKGPSRPVNTADDRVRVIAALNCVDYVVVFEDTRVTSLLQALCPGIWVKGGDYTIESLCAEEVEMARAGQTEIVILPLRKGYSTTETIKKLGVG